MKIAGSAVLAVVCVALTSIAEAEPMSYQISPQHPAFIKFTVDAPLDSIVGTTVGVTGSARFDEASGSGTAKVSVDLKTFRTGISLRDEDLRDRFFESTKYPAATLNVQRVSGTPGRQEIAGTLSLHGVERVIKIPATLRFGTLEDRPAVSVEAHFKVVFSDYEIQRPKALFLKLGESAIVDVQAVWVATEPPKPEAAQTSEVKPLETPKPLFAKGAFIPVVAAKVTKASRPKFRFASGTPEGRGERLMEDTTLGAERNSMTCASCHSSADERTGIKLAGQVKPSRSLFDVAKRPQLWQGLAKTPGKASALCVRLFLLNPKGLSPAQEHDIDAYLKAISPDDAVAALDYKALHLTRKSSLANPTKGDRKRGAELEKQFCEGCHAAGKLRPPLTPGLYEADYLVRRVRWLPGTDARQMPPIYVDRLTDTDLRNIITYLAGDESRRIFDRRVHP
jgi:polyisoprenoid-binding protein YceI